MAANRKSRNGAMIPPRSHKLEHRETPKFLSVVGYNSEFTRYTISKAIVMPSLPSVATVVLSHGISSGKKAVIRHAIPATMLLIAKGRRRPMRSIVIKIRRAAGNSTAPEMKKSR